MATAAANINDPDEALETESEDSAALDKVFERAMQRFDLAVLPQLEQRSLALAARRFVSIPGAQWEGDFGDFFDDAIKLEINLTKDGLEKIYRDYNENRIVPDFRPAGGKGDEVSADTLDGLHRADAYHFKAQQAWDNAFIEGTSGGFGAYRLTNEWADPYDPKSDAQRINPGYIITDADQRVFFDPDSKLYDKSDASFAFVLTAQNRTLFEEEHEESIASWPEEKVLMPGQYDWFPPNQVIKAEYYEVEDHSEKLLILEHKLSGKEERYWASEIDSDELADLRKMGWTVRTRQLQRKRVHKYVMSGAEVLADKGIIAGDRIPVAPYYGKRSFVDGVERFEGYVQGKMDVQKLYNMAVSRLAETSAMSPRELPIVTPQQIAGHEASWARQVVDRPSYALLNPLLNPSTGEPIALGPVGKVEAPQVDPSTAAVIQIARNDLTQDQQDGSDTAKANTSEEALAFAATRVDAKSGIFLDNWRQTIQCGGEVYLSMSADIYYEPGREIETMTEDGNDGTATLVQQYVDPVSKQAGIRNDFSRGHYKVVVDVTEATATRREKTVKSCIAMAEASAQLVPQLGQAALITAAANMDGEGSSDFQKYARKLGIQQGVIQPSDEEKQQMEQDAQTAAQQPPSAADTLAAAKAKEAEASAVQKAADAHLKNAQADAIGGPEQAPKAPDGLDAFHKIAQTAKTVAEARKITTDTQHMPEKLNIEKTNAATNAAKAHHSVLTGFAKLFTRGKPQ